MSLQEKVAFLLTKGWSQEALAVSAKTTQPTISRIKNGANTSFDIGKAINDLYLSEVESVD